MSDVNVISVGGYGYTGGTAVKDLLREIKDFSVLDVEFRLIKDPYGLMDLENNLVHNWRNHLNSDIHIKDFLWFVQNLARVNGKLNKLGLNYSGRINKDFIKLTIEFLNKICDFEYDGNWHLLLFKEFYLKQLYSKVRRRFHHGKTHTQKMYYSKPSRDLFVDASKEYIRNLFSNFNNSNVVLQNAIDTYNPEQGLNYFNSAKMIIIDRDPRDIYVDVIKKHDASFLGEALVKNRDVQKFINDFKNRRERLNEIRQIKDILIIRFEEFINNYDELLMDIFSFLGIDKSSHVEPRFYFNPDKSKKNIGLWKSYKYQKEIRMIEKELFDFCYDITK